MSEAIFKISAVISLLSFRLEGRSRKTHTLALAFLLLKTQNEDDKMILSHIMMRVNTNANMKGEISF